MVQLSLPRVSSGSAMSCAGKLSSSFDASSRLLSVEEARAWFWPRSTPSSKRTQQKAPVMRSSCRATGGLSVAVERTSAGFACTAETVAVEADVAAAAGARMALAAADLRRCDAGDLRGESEPLVLVGAVAVLLSSA